MPLMKATTTLLAGLAVAAQTVLAQGVTDHGIYPLDGSVSGERGGSLNSNPTVANADLTVRGSSWLWAAFAIMLSSGIGVLAWALSRPIGTRAFHYIGVMILFTASIAYFTMASDLGSVAIFVEYVRYNGDLFTNRAITPYTRSIWYVRYIDWVVTTPLLLLELLLATGLPLGEIVITIFFDEVMIIAGLIGALVVSQYKWGYFVGACVAEIFITYMLLVPARSSAKALGATAQRAYFSSALILSVLWFLYPIAWGLADGGNVISTDSEMIFYGILDVLAKPVFLIYHLFSLRKVPYESFQLQSGHFSAYTAGPTNSNYNHHERGNGPISQEHSNVAHNPVDKAAKGNKKIGRRSVSNGTPAATTATNTDLSSGPMHVVGGGNGRVSDATTAV